MNLRLHRLAEEEIRNAAEWYEARGEGLGHRFLADVRSALDRLESDPSQYASLETTSKSLRFQRILLDEFPYLIVYERFESETFVYAVAHASQTAVQPAANHSSIFSATSPDVSLGETTSTAKSGAPGQKASFGLDSVSAPWQ